jgi:tetratricopeptide (TPR) repeat protein
MKRPRTAVVGSTVALLVAAGPRLALQHREAVATRPVLPASVGALHHPIRSVDPLAQTLMDEGLTLYYGFNRDAARRSFTVAAASDPGAAMPHVGMALALGPNINMDASASEIESACASARRGLELSKQPDERGYADALVTRYCGTDNRSGLNAARYAQAMKSLHAALPTDPDAAVLYADSLLQLRPRTVRDDQEIVTVLEGVLQRQPDHVGANHFYIHAVEGTSSPDRGLASAKRLETLVPGIGHLLHMPSHIYMRTGQYDAALAVNRRAATADLAFLRANPPGHDGAMYYLHDLESLAVAAGFTGRLADARAAAQEIARVEAELAGESVDRRFSAPLAMVYLRFQKWADVEALPIPPESDAASSFLSRFARGVAFAAAGQADKARREHEAFDRAARAIPLAAYFRSNPMSLLRPVYDAVLTARLAGRDVAAATNAWRDAVNAQDRLVYHEPPPFYQPIRESLGASLVAAGRYADAEQVFREELAQHPGSGRALFGRGVHSKDAAKAKRPTAFSARSRRRGPEATWRSRWRVTDRANRRAEIQRSDGTDRLRTDHVLVSPRHPAQLHRRSG